MAGNKVFGGGIFQSTDIGELRRARREGLLGQALGGVQSSQGRMGATLGTLFGDGLRQAIHGDPPEIQRAKAVKQVQSWAAENGLNIAKDPKAFFAGVATKFEELGIPDLAQQTLVQGAQWQKEMLPVQKFENEQSKRARTVVGGTPEAQALAQEHDLQLKPGETYEVMFEGATPRVTAVDRLGSNQNINIGGEISPFQKQVQKNQAARVESRVEAGTLAGNMLETLTDLEDIVTDPGFRSGAWQPLITTLQGFAEGAGLDLTGIAEKAGINLGKLSTQQEFNRLSDVLTTEMFSKFKGNLNTQEVRIAKNAVTQLGKTPEANVMAIASLMASAELAQERGNQALEIATREDLVNFEKSVHKAGTDEFRKRRDKIAERLKQKVGKSAYVVEESASGSIDFRNIKTLDQLNALDRSKMTKEELKEAAKLWNKLNGN